MRVFQLQAANVSYNGRRALAEVSLAIEAGERVALVGKSGAGKSTLLNLLYRQQTARCALVPQDYALVKPLSVFHNVYIGRLNRHAAAYNLLNLAWPLPREVEPVRAVLRRVALEEKLFTPVGELSGGQQQRTAVARALHQGGEVLLGDEPVSSVDELQSREVLAAINQDFRTVVLAMHDVALALAFTDRVIGLQGGRIVLDRPTAGLQPGDLDSLYRS
ncbi:MAG: ATP-binding cassette domain-containing protein [Candidatus Lambdaproteobacteria bacterium]|nr:ATP-binding cassette domain-containing protein [Candidatus Lambdaproteobacteria bacterium]